MKDVNCPNCGATNPGDYTFCFHCRALPGAEGKKSSAKKSAKKSATKSVAKKK